MPSPPCFSSNGPCMITVSLSLAWREISPLSLSFIRSILPDSFPSSGYISVTTPFGAICILWIESSIIYAATSLKLFIFPSSFMTICFKVSVNPIPFISSPFIRSAYVIALSFAFVLFCCSCVFPTPYIMPIKAHMPNTNTTAGTMNLFFSFFIYITS